MKAIIASKRFNPGHVSHLVANAKLLKEGGFKVLFSINSLFYKFSECDFDNHKACLSDFLSLSKGDLLIIWFPSISILFDIFLVRILTSATIVYVYHEPYTSYASYRRSGFSKIKVLKIFIVSLVSRFISNLSHKIILPSERSYNTLRLAKTNLRRYAKINLLFWDESNPDQLNKHRIFISYIGTIAEDHAFDEFVHLMQASIKANTLVPFRFLIATRSEIPEKFSSIVKYGISSGRLTLYSGVPMTNSQINDFYAQSYVVWNAYRRSMQSGVLPKAYMFGSPIIVSESNQSEYFKDGVHGVLISDRYDPDEFKNAIGVLGNKWKTLSENCRDFYLKNFDYKALSIKFMEFIIK